jgi:cytochrome c oxidase subunit 2
MDIIRNWGTHDMKRRKVAGRIALLLAMMTTLLTGCGGVFDPQGPVAKDQFFLIKFSFGIMLVVMVVVFALFIYALVRYRKRKGQTGYPDQVEGSHKLEIIWTVIPFILVILLGVITVMYTFKAADQANDKGNMQIKVIAHQFWWEFIYTDLDIHTAQDLVIPENTWVTVELESNDVVHSFWVPQLAGKMDTNPGITNRMSFKSDVAGKVFKGKCAELCGASHALMDFKVVTKSAEDFETWMANMKTPIEVTAATEAGSQVFTNQCIGCHAVTVDSASAGPNLAGFADRDKVAGYRDNTEDYLRQWISDPQELKPGTSMPKIPLSDQELDDLVVYLQSLKQ